MIDDKDLVGKIEDEIALIAETRQTQRHRLELEHQIVAEGAVKPEMLVLRARKQIDQRAQHREDRGLPTAFFFGKALLAFANLPRDAVVGS